MTQKSQLVHLQKQQHLYFISESDYVWLMHHGYICDPRLVQMSGHQIQGLFKAFSRLSYGNLQGLQ